MIKQRRLVWTTAVLLVVAALLIGLRVGHRPPRSSGGQAIELQVTASGIGRSKSSLPRPLRSGTAHDPASSPEFFAASVDVPEPVLARFGAGKIEEAHRRWIDRQLLVIQHSLGVSAPQLRAIRHDLEKSSHSLRHPEPDIQSVARVRAEAEARQQEWVETAQQIVRAHLSRSQQARYDEQLAPKRISVPLK